MFLNLPGLSCRIRMDYIDLCLLPTDCLLSHLLPIPTTLILKIRSGTISEHVCSSMLP